jgi:hypothetical protein
MTRKTLTLKLNGDVPLALFARAIQHFNALVDGLTVEVTGEELPWEVADLHGGSAYVAVVARSDDDVQIDKVLRAYDEVGEALRRHEPIPYSPAVSHAAWSIANLVNGEIKSIDLGSPFNTYTIKEPIKDRSTDDGQKPQIAWGTLYGEVGSIIKRPRLQLTLFDSLFDRAVPCFLHKNQESDARQAWGRQVAVTGRIYRNADNGRPLKIRDVISIEIIEPQKSAYQHARGAIPFSPDDVYPETQIRRLRDEI